MFRKITVIFALVCTISLSGCMNAVMNMVADSFPTYEETVKNWPELDENHSRIVLFTLDRELHEISIGPFEPFSEPYCEVTIDGVEYPGRFPGTFFFIDVVVGDHTLHCTNSSTSKITLNSKGAEIVYISGGAPLNIFKIENIQDQLKVLNHGFDEALPYDDQPITIKRRSKE
ncbi:MAG: hypothetical protein QNK36_10595 [Colwellia sp.]|nr:hypothetical protein [Colwellia sp.]